MKEFDPTDLFAAKRNLWPDHAANGGIFERYQTLGSLHVSTDVCFGRLYSVGGCCDLVGAVIDGWAERTDRCYIFWPGCTIRFSRVLSSSVRIFDQKP